MLESFLDINNRVGVEILRLSEVKRRGEIGFKEKRYLYIYISIIVLAKAEETATEHKHFQSQNQILKMN